MSVLRITDTFLFLFFYSVLGWMIESIYCGVLHHKFVNRGFLNGPYCPIYGTGAVAMVALVALFPQNILLCFLVGAVAGSVIEYVTSYVMEKLFQTKWWDYSKNKFNLHGRICPLYAVFWGGLGVALWYVIHPLMERFVEAIPASFRPYLALTLLFVMLVDTAVTVKATLALNVRIKQLSELAASLRDLVSTEKEELKERMEEGIAEMKEGLQQRQEAVREAAKSAGETLRAQYEALLQKNIRLHNRLLSAFPRFRSLQSGEGGKLLRERLHKHREKK